MTRLSKNFDPFELKNCFIAGGAILSSVTKTDINDYDIYPKNFDGFVDVLYSLRENGAYVVSLTDRAITYICNHVHDRNGNRVTAQVMLFDWFDTPKKIFDYFDFTVCMAAYDCDTNEYTFHDKFYPDVASKTLRFNHNTKYPLGSLIRVQKYKNKGFNIGKLEYAKIALAICQRGMPRSWRELEAQIGGIYGKELSLQTEGIEYSYENAIEVLSNMDLDIGNYMSDNSENYSKMTIEDIVSCYETSFDKFIEIDDRHYCYVDDYFLKKPFSKLFADTVGIPRNVKKVNPDKLYGYETESSFYSTNNVYINKPTDIKKSFKLVSFDTSNILRISGKNGTNILLKNPNTKTIKTVESETTQEDDILEHINEMLTT